MAGVIFEKVSKTFEQTVVIPGLDLVIEDAEFVSLLGPSGCGKTTSLRMLAGLEQPTSGRILIGGRTVNNLPPSQRDIAMVFQSYALYPHMSVAENILYPLKKRGVPKSEHAGRLKAVADLLQLAQLLKRTPKQLSGGQQQRVALGRALVRDPQVFLLDEPLSNLDAKLRAHMRAELIELHQRLGKTMIYVTHDQLEAMTMSTRIAVMKGGLLQQFATPSDIYHRPANAFVAGFVGTPSMSLADAELVCTEGSAVLRLQDMVLPLRADYLIDGAMKSGEVTIGLRPEDVLLGSGAHRGIIKVIEPTGHETIVIMVAGGVPFTARVPGEMLGRPGDTVPIDFRLDRIHVFDRHTGARLNRDRDDASSRAFPSRTGDALPMRIAN